MRQLPNNPTNRGPQSELSALLVDDMISTGRTAEAVRWPCSSHEKNGEKMVRKWKKNGRKMEKQCEPNGNKITIRDNSLHFAIMCLQFSDDPFSESILRMMISSNHFNSESQFHSHPLHPQGAATVRQAGRASRGRRLSRRLVPEPGGRGLFGLGGCQSCAQGGEVRIRY